MIPMKTSDRKMKMWGTVAFVAAIMVLAFSSFQSQTEIKKQPLVVKRQQCILQFMVGDIPSEDFHIGITMDISVDGDPVLVDSVMRLLNQALYFFFDDDSRFHIRPEDVYPLFRI